MSILFRKLFGYNKKGLRLKNAWEISVYNFVDKILNTIVYLSVSETGSSTGEE